MKGTLMGVVVGLVVMVGMMAGAVVGNTITVHNNCGQGYAVYFRGPYDKLYEQGYVNAGGSWASKFDYSNCGVNGGCNIGINMGSTLLAEFDHDGKTIWWNLSTDAGYQNPPFRFTSSAPGSASMYCNSQTCPDGHPGDSHINAVGGQYDLIVTYCG